ncbi:MAG: SDR family oxidoreductase [Myxococcota bacterium]
MAEVFLTGATGFLGGELLRELLEHDRRRIACLIRAESADAAQLRGAEALDRALGRPPRPEERARVDWVWGDIEAPGLGWSDAQRAGVVREVREIFHCAATTRFDLPLDEAERVNVVGLRSIVELAESCRAHGSFRRLHHVSTAYVAGMTNGDAIADDLPADDHTFRNSYERTKARAERALRTHATLPVSIYRPSIIIGDSRRGRTTGWSTIYFPMRMVAGGHVRYLPWAGAQRLDCVPVDFVARAIRVLARRDDTLGRCFHLTAGNEAITVERLLRETLAGIARRGEVLPDPPARGVGRLGWGALSLGYRLFATGARRRGFERFREYVPYLRISTVFDNRRELELLAKEGVPLPDVDQFLCRVVDFALAQNFGRDEDRPRIQTR